MDVSAFLDHIDALPGYSGQLTHREDIPPRRAAYSELERPLAPKLQHALESSGVESLYSHQAEAIDAARNGENVIVATAAASGKSLCYHVPILDALLEDRAARALLLFPTKALTQDQSRSVAALLPESSRLRHHIFDGDTPSEERAGIRRSTRIVLTNPDMLHAGILPNHRSWYRLFQGLKYVVIDEAHVYRGVFGSHVANVIRRLRRICRRLGSEPRFILCSATIANPREHAERLVGLPFRVVEEDGAPYGGKDFLFWNPPMIDMAAGSRRSTNGETAVLMEELLKRRVRTLAFVRSRRMAELLYVIVRDRLRNSSPTEAGRLSPYRASYLPEDRRRIERDLFEGRLLGLTSTNAMELGIDIGDLDATLLSGYPGSISSTWQQAGRSGRRGERSLSVLVAFDNPLDQYLMRHPETFFGKSTESVRISPTNPYVLKPQLLCAAYEAPLTAEDSALFDADVPDSVGELAADGFLHFRHGRWHLDSEITYPAQDVNIRSASSSYYTLADRESGAVLETVDEWSAFSQLFPGAVYLHKGDPYLISDLDIESHTAYAARTDAPYYTEVRELTETRILNVYKSHAAGRTTAYLGEVSVTTSVVGFARRANLTSELLGDEYVDLPPRRYNTVSVWFDVPRDTLGRIAVEKLDLAGGLHAVEHAAIGVLPLFALCDRNDIGGISTPLHPDTGRPQVFIHDGHPGGVGICEHGYEIIEDLWRATLDVVSDCPCSSGCPSCIHSPKCGNNNQPLDKAVAILILRSVLGLDER
jgi:DEAD/DEAH box helicase domain-containing protein